MSGFLHFCMLGFLCFIVTYLWSLPCFILSLLSLQAYFPRSVSSSTTAYGVYVCMYCSANEKEDEAHFLIKCDKLNNKREEWFKLISSKWKISPIYLIIRNYIISLSVKIKKSYNLSVGFYMKTCLKLMLTNLIYIYLFFYYHVLIF
jgi:hypothetical protein